MSSSASSSQSELAMMVHDHVPHHRGFDHSTQQQQQQKQTLYHPMPQLQQRQRNLSGSNYLEGGKRPHQQEQQQRGERQRGRTNSNSGNHSQYASKFSSSNSNIILQHSSPKAGRQQHRTTTGVASAIATLAHVGASSLGMNPSHMSTAADSTGGSISGSMGQGHHSSSTTTTFYSGVKLAPPLLSANVIAHPLMEQHHQHQHQHQHNTKGLDPKTWYTIQVQPCDLILPSVTSTTIGATSKSGGLDAHSATSIRRKPYRIYRRYEDVVDFADQLEDEFPELIAPHQPPATPSVVNENGTHRTLAYKGDPFSSAILDSIRGHSLGVAGNHPMVTKSATPASATATSAPNDPTGAGALDHGDATVALPRLRSKLVLFATKAACLQRKEELDRYLAELFALGPIMAQSRLVAEFFGIWKTDMEMHLSQEDRDPLALHSGITTTPAAGAGCTGTAVAETTVSQTDAGVLPALTNDTKQSKQSQGSGASRVHAIGPTSRMEYGNKVNEEDIQAIISAALHPNRTTAQTSLSFSSSSSLSSPSLSLHHSVSAPMPSSPVFTTTTTLLSTIDNKPGRLHLQSNTRHPDFESHDTYLASPALSPNPVAMSRESFSGDFDSEMTSPTVIDETESASIIEETVEYGPTAENGRPLVDDIATRTLKKFKSLRRSHISTTSSSQQQQLQQDQRSGSQSSVLSSHVSSSSGSSFSPSPVIVGGLGSSSAQPMRAKVMKRSKTAVFRTEVSMQPLSSRNVIPPWNRIPSSISTPESSANNRAAPISPVSPISPGDGSSSLVSHGSRVSSPSVEEPNPFDIRASELTSEERPRPLKLTMSQSKTMPTLNMWGEEYPTMESSFGGITMTKSSTATNAEQPQGRLGTGGFGGRSMSVSSGTPASFTSSTGAIPTTAPLIAPWNRVDPNSETNTHLHSLIKISGQQSPSILGASGATNSPFVPVELGRSFLKKESAAAAAAVKRSNTMSARALLEHQRVVPVLNLPPSKVKPTSSSTEDTTLSDSTAMIPPKRKGMTHSVSAPSGLVPRMVISAPRESSPVLQRAGTQNTNRGDPRKPLPKRGSLASSVALSSSDMDHTSPVPGSFPAGTTVTTTLTKKRYPRRESGPHSPPMTTKQPVGILKKTAHQPPPQHLVGGRKASLTVPSSGIFPVRPLPLHSILGTAGGGGSLSSSPIPSPTPSSSLITTFKIVMDADTIVALQVVEDKDFVLTLSDLQARVRSKLLKSNIQLPETFELIWSSVASASGTSATALATSSVESAGTTPLKTDEDLHTAILGSRNHKVTLRCNV